MWPRSGAVIALTALARGSAIDRLVAFEPPLFARRPLPVAELARFEGAIARGDAAAALTAAGKAVELVPVVRFLPSWLLTALVRRAIAGEAERPATGEPTLGEIALSLQYDFRVVGEVHGQRAQWKGIRAGVLLMGGAKSPGYLRADLDALQELLPHARRLTLPGLDHGASWNRHPQRNRRGNPGVVAQELRRFFTGESP